MPGRWRWLPLVAIVYIPFIGGGLLTDDFAHFQRLSPLEAPAQIATAPDAFGFYRPVTQASIALDVALHGERPARFRALNVLLHAGVIALAFAVAYLVLSSSQAAGLAALAFALTPKAHPIAVLWISARGELLMALFSLAAVAAWMVWTRGGRAWWLVGAGASYGLAILCKETATLLPVLLLVTPRAERPIGHRVGAVAALTAIAVVVFAWRSYVGALMPFSGDAHYDLIAPVARLLRSATNYAGRMIASPAALLAVVSIAALVSRRRPTQPSSPVTLSQVATFSIAWSMIFLAPVLPLTLRSEIYLYLPVLGICLLAGWAAERLTSGTEFRPAAAVAIGVYALGFMGYQVVRARDIHEDLVFSERLVAALQKSPALADREGRVLLVPSDAATERFLQDAIGGYLPLVMERARGDTRLTGDVQYAADAPRDSELRLLCDYRAGRISLTQPQ